MKASHNRIKEIDRLCDVIKAILEDLPDMTLGNLISELDIDLDEIEDADFIRVLADYWESID